MNLAGLELADIEEYGLYERETRAARESVRGAERRLQQARLEEGVARGAVTLSRAGYGHGG